MRNKYSLLAIVFTCLLLAGCGNNTTTNELETEKPEEITHYISKTIEYSDDGNILCITEFDYDDYDNEVYESKRVEYSYDSDNLLVAICTYYGGEDECSREDIYSYDKSGNILSIKGTNEDTEYEYDADGNCLSVESYDSKGRLTEQERYTYKNGIIASSVEYSCEYEDYEAYDEDGNAIEVDGQERESYFYTDYDGQGRPTEYKEIYSVDEGYITTYQYLGNRTIMTERYYLDDEDDVSETGICEYDSLGRQTKYSGYDSDGNLENQITFEYGDKMYTKTTYALKDDNENEIQLCSKEEFYYDDNERLIKTIEYNCNGDVLNTVEYSFDDFGNLQSISSILEDGTKDTTTAPIREYSQNGTIIKETFYNDEEYLENYQKAEYYKYNQDEINIDCIQYVFY